MGLRNAIVYVLLAAPLGFAHPHGMEDREFQHAAQPMYRRTLAHCQEAFAEPQFMKRTIERRHEEWSRLRKERGFGETPALDKRQLSKVLATDHYVNKQYSEKTSAAELFADSGACMLTPETTEGPLYVKGEEVRRNLTEGEGGVPMTIDIQVVDVKTCQPLVDAAVDFWSCNSTGVYGGVLNYPGNGNPNDLSLINVTTLRGIQFTDKEGLATFDTVIPGHYAGRTHHVHAIAHLGAVKQPNNTITGGKVAHIGQMYFDQKLVDEMETLPPYSSNKQTWTKNAQDMLLRTAASSDDPVVRYTLVGNKLSDGIYAWIRFGVDASANRPLNPAAYKDANGGHQMPGGFGGGGFPGGFPGGIPGFPVPTQTRTAPTTMPM